MINCLMLFREIKAVYPRNHAKPINILCGHNAELLISYCLLKQVVHITYSCHWALKGQKFPFGLQLEFCVASHH
jgi:triacylglycerol esterase/lipase EstA (alpha/beta hydrolase family)